MSEDESQEEDASDEEDVSGLESDDEELMGEGGDDEMGDLQLNGDLAGAGLEADDSDSDVGPLDDEPTAGQVLNQPAAAAAAAAGTRAQLLDDEDEDDALDGVGEDSLDSDEDEDDDEALDEDEEEDEDGAGDEPFDIEKRAQALDRSRYALLGSCEAMPLLSFMVVPSQPLSLATDLLCLALCLCGSFWAISPSERSRSCWFASACPFKLPSVMTCQSTETGHCIPTKHARCNSKADASGCWLAGPSRRRLQQLRQRPWQTSQPIWMQLNALVFLMMQMRRQQVKRAQTIICEWDSRPLPSNDSGLVRNCTCVSLHLPCLLTRGSERCSLLAFCNLLAVQTHLDCLLK